MEKIKTIFMIITGTIRIRLARALSGLKPIRIEYSNQDGLAVEMDLYLPENPVDQHLEGPAPVIIWVHGGAWKFGNIKEIEPAALAQVKKGYALASIGYSMSKDAQWPTQIHQVKAGIRFLRVNAEKYNLDPNRFIAWGASSGGHMANMLGVTGSTKELEGNYGYSDTSSAVQAVISWYGASNFLAMGNSGMVNHTRTDSPESRLIGGALDECTEKVAIANPINFVTESTPPFLLMHGVNDQLVPLNQSELMHQALSGAGVESELIRFPSYTHADPRFNSGRSLRSVEKFLDQHTKR